MLRIIDIQLCGGKPYLSGSQHIHFNISHSGQWVVLMLSEYHVGVDIEQSCEINRLSSYTGRQKLSCFYDLWTGFSNTAI